MKKNSKNNLGYIYDAIITAFDLETKLYTMEWEKINKHTEKEDNYTPDQISRYLHPEELSKFEVGETIRKKFKEDGLWHEGCIESINHENKLYHVKYDNNDVEDMTIVEIPKHWVETEPEDKNSSIE